MSLTADKIIADAKKVAGRLKDRTTLGDTLIMEAEYINEQLESLRSVQEEFDALNLLGRNHTNNQMVHAINQEHPHLRDIQMQNRELRACLQDYQRALEHIMTKYREHTQKKILNSQVSFTYLSQNDARFNNKYIDKILEMVAVMRSAADADERNYERAGREQDILINKLLTENKGLREMLQISRDFGAIAQTAPTTDAGSQTDDVCAAQLQQLQHDEHLEMNDNDNTLNSSVSSVVMVMGNTAGVLIDGSDEDLRENNTNSSSTTSSNSTTTTTATTTKTSAEQTTTAAINIGSNNTNAAATNNHINNNTINAKCNNANVAPGEGGATTTTVCDASVATTVIVAGVDRSS